jgi:hypothetical protein
MPAGYGVGDHRMFVIDIQEASLVGTEPFCVQRYFARQLNKKVLSGATKKRLEENISRHRLIKKLGNLHRCHKRRKSFQCALNKLNKQSRNLMLNAEKKCCQIRLGTSHSRQRPPYGFDTLRSTDCCLDIIMVKFAIRAT